MFSSQEYLDKKTGPYGIGRLSYLQSLVTEYEETSSDDAKRQILANLANFGYDPLNYDYFRQLNVLDMFLDALEEGDEKFVEFGIGGLCNVCLDKQNKEYIVKNDGIDLVQKCLSHSNVETKVSALTTLMFLICPESKKDILTLDFAKQMLELAESSNLRLSNLANIFLKDYFDENQVEEARKSLQTS